MTWRGRVAVFLALAVLVVACGAPPATTVPSPTATMPEPSAVAAVATATPTPTPTPTARPVSYIPPACQGRPIVTARPGATPQPTATPQPDKPIERSLQLRVLETLAGRIEERYLYPDFNGKDLTAIVARYRAEIEAGLDTPSFYQRMHAFIADLGDEHSSFESPVRKAAADAQLAGTDSFVGVGLYVQPVLEKGYVTVLAVIPDSPAAHSGLQPHDAILTVNGLRLIEDGLFQNLFRGPECSAVVMEVRMPGGLVERRTVVRARVSAAVPIDARLVPTTDGSRVAYIMVPTFFDTTIDDQVRDALARLAPLDGLILDNRENGGGSSRVLEPMLGLFTSGAVGAFVSRTSSRTLSIRAASVGNSQTVPLVVLIGHNTVSFGEIFSGILQDRGRAKLVGETTRGNVETLHAVNLPDGSRAWIAQEGFEAARSGVNWERTGVVPELEVQVAWEDVTFERDPAVKRALEVLGRR